MNNRSTTPGGRGAATQPDGVTWRSERGWLLALVVLTVTPRIPGLDAGLPLLLNPDEIQSLGFARAIDVSGDLRGRPWTYPPLLGDLMFVMLRLLRSLGVCGDACSDGQVLLAGRWISVMAASAGVMAVHGAARMLRVAALPAATAAMTLAWSPTFVAMSRFATPDALATAGVCGSLMCAVGIARGARRRWYVLAALALGITGGAKYNAGLVAVCVVVAHVGSPRAKSWIGWLVVSAVGAFGVFVVSLLPPWAGLDPILEGLGYEWRHYGRGHGGFTTPDAARDALRYLVSFAWGLAPASALVVGATLRARNVRAMESAARWSAGATAGFIVGYMALISRGDMFVDRVLLPIMPGLALLLALALQLFMDEVRARMPGRSTVVCGLLLSAMVAGSGWRVVQQATAVAVPDSRLRAREWMLDRLDPSQVRIAVVPNSALKLFRGRKDYRVQAVKVVRPNVLRSVGFTHVVYGIGSYQRYLRTADRFPEKSAEAAEHTAALEREAAQIERFDGPAVPGAGRFGNTASLYHQYTVEIWAL